MATRATITTTPFKGESFPAYIVSRTNSTARRSLVTASNSFAPSSSSLPHHHGPSTIDLAKPSLIFSPTRAAVDGSSMPVAGSSTLSTTKSSIKTPLRRQRPSLSEQLRVISRGAECVTAQLRSSYHLNDSSDSTTTVLQQRSASVGSTCVHTRDCILEATTISLSVGRLDCRFPCPVYFASDRCSYLFQHPFDPKEIQMIMYYRDMRQIQLSLHERSLRFRISHTLEQFGADYRASNPQHCLKMVFATASEATKVKQFLSKFRSELGASTQSSSEQLTTDVEPTKRFLHT